jgi:hypothetical protein
MLVRDDGCMARPLKTVIKLATVLLAITAFVALIAYASVGFGSLVKIKG